MDMLLVLFSESGTCILAKQTQTAHLDPHKKLTLIPKGRGIPTCRLNSCSKDAFLRYNKSLLRRGLNS